MAACKGAKVRDIQTGLNLVLVLNTRTRILMAETRDLRMANCNYYPSSIQSSVIDSVISPSIQPSIQSSTQSSVAFAPMS